MGSYSVQALLARSPSGATGHLDIHLGGAFGQSIAQAGPYGHGGELGEQWKGRMAVADPYG